MEMHRIASLLHEPLTFGGSRASRDGVPIATLLALPGHRISRSPRV
jgi:hypothetical protein